MQRYNQFLLDYRITDSPPIPANIALPIIEHASLEEDDVLFELWTDLLVLEVDPAIPRGIRAAFVWIIQELDPPDAQILGPIYRDTEGLREASIPHFIKSDRLIVVVNQ